MIVREGENMMNRGMPLPLRDQKDWYGTVVKSGHGGLRKWIAKGVKKVQKKKEKK